MSWKVVAITDKIIFSDKLSHLYLLNLEEVKAAIVRECDNLRRQPEMIRNVFRTLRVSLFVTKYLLKPLSLENVITFVWGEGLFYV